MMKKLGNIYFERPDTSNSCNSIYSSKVKFFFFKVFNYIFIDMLPKNINFINGVLEI